MNSPSAFALICPVCGGQIEKTSERLDGARYACTECLCAVTVPAAAWDIARVKREQKWRMKQSSFDPLRRLFGAGVSIASGRGTRDK
jgi:reverse gyrase